MKTATAKPKRTKAPKQPKQPKQPMVRPREGSWKYDLMQNWQLYLLFIPVLVFFLVFHYAPMFGLLMAFERFKPSKGIFGSQWIGMENLRDVFSVVKLFKVLCISS